MEFDPLSKQVIGSAIEAHRHLGPGLLESTYESCLAKELELQGLRFELQRPLLIDFNVVLLKHGIKRLVL
jgi:GxxExxY protein